MAHKQKIQTSNILYLLFVTYLTVLPFEIGPTGRYILSFLLIAVAIRLLSLQKKENLKILLPELMGLPVVVFLLLLDIIAAVSIIFSPDPFYSTAVYFEEFFLNSILFLSIATLMATTPEAIDWQQSLRIANIVFIIVYIGVMLQWILFPSHPLFQERSIASELHTRWDRLFAFGNGCTLFHGIKHTSLFLTLVISFWAVRAAQAKLSKTGMTIFLMDLFALISTTRRAASLAVVAGICASSILFRHSSRYLKAALLFFGALGIFFVISGNGGYFIRENWHLLLHGEVQKARDQGGSIPLRINTYKVFSEYIMENPFKPNGLGRKLIKEYRADLVKKAGLIHGHNTFLNFAFYMGIQGALTLLCLIICQARLLWQKWREEPHGEYASLMAVSLIFMLMFWATNMFTDGFCHGSATMYWLFTGLSTGVAIRHRLTRRDTAKTYALRL